jgi:hypothetical protein
MSATLQTVVDQCVSYKRDSWRGPVGHNGKPVHTLSANVAESNVDPDPRKPFGVLAAKPFNYHLNCWRKSLTENKGKCLLCFNSACNTDHKTCNCPILKKLGLKFEKRSHAGNSTHDNVSRVATYVAGTSPSPAPPPPTSGIHSLDNSSSSSIPGTFTASTDAESYDLGEEFNYEGKCEGAFYSPSGKSKNGVGVYFSPSPSCCHVCTKPWVENGGSTNPKHSTSIENFAPAATHPIVLDGGLSCRSSLSNPRGICTIYLPKKVLVLL